MSSLKKKLFLVGLSVALSFAVLVLCLKVSETYFFDKFYYDKSPTYGYISGWSNALKKEDNPPVLETRLRDLRELFLSTSKEQQVLTPQAPDDKIFTIVISGDSIAYGAGVKTDRSFPRVLEKMLSKIRPTRVYNLSQPGDSIVDNYYKFEVAKEKIHPDLVIFTGVDNDLLVDSPNKYPGEQAFYDELRQSCPQEEFVGNWKGLPVDANQDYMLEHMFIPSYKDDGANICYLKTIAPKLAAEKNVFFYFFGTVEHLDKSADPVQQKELNLIRKYTDVLKEAKVPVFGTDNLDGFTYEQVSKQEVHPSVKTQKAFAESLEKELTQNPQWGFKQ